MNDKKYVSSVCAIQDIVSYLAKIENCLTLFGLGQQIKKLFLSSS